MSTAWGSALKLDRDPLPRIVEMVDTVGAAVDADGSNGLTRCSAAEAARRGLYVPPGAESVPLVAYDRRDLGSRSLWAPKGRLPYGLDAPENGCRIVRDHTDKIVLWRCFGILPGPDGSPHVQGAEDPAPGAFLSTTSLTDGRWPPTSAHRYFDSAALPGWVLPGHDLDGLCRIGDIALVSYAPTGRSVWCQCFDSGNSGRDRIELSVYACEQLGIDSNARTGGCSGGVKVVILPGSRESYWDAGILHTLSADQIQEAGRAAARAAGLQIGG